MLEGVGILKKRIHSRNRCANTLCAIINNGKFLDFADSWAKAYKKVRGLNLDMWDEEVDKEKWLTKIQFKVKNKVA